MQESLFNTIKKLQTEDKINVEELETLLGTGIEEVVGLCKKACLKPKTDSMGNAYFTKNDVDTLKKIKELYSQSQAEQGEIIQKNIIEEAPLKNNDKVDMLNSKVNFLERAKNRVKNDIILSSGSNAASVAQAVSLQNQLEKFEKKLIDKMGELLSEKMDGFDEIIVELIRSKTENENLRQQVNNINKQLFVMKKELASYTPLPFGLYSKKDVEDI